MSHFCFYNRHKSHTFNAHCNPRIHLKSYCMYTFILSRSATTELNGLYLLHRIYCTVFIAPYLLHRIYFRCNSVECSVLLTKVSCAGHTLNGHFFNSSLGFQYEKFFQNTVPPYVSFLLVIGQISAYVWSISYFRK